MENKEQKNKKNKIKKADNSSASFGFNKVSKNSKNKEIIDRKKIEKELNRQKEEYQIIFDSIPAGIFYKDKDNKFVKVNQVFCDMMERKKEQMEGKSNFDFYSKKEAEALWKEDLEVINSGKPKRNIIQKDDSFSKSSWFKTDKVPYYNAEKEIIGIVGFRLDITEEKEAEEKLKEKLDEMEKINRLMVGRELKMIELKNKLEKLEKKQ